jgi:hypothetical protein
MNLIECLNEGVSYLKESKFQIYPLNDYDIIPIIKLYSNCKEISSISIHDGSGGLTMTSISPENWFVDILPSILEGASMVVCSRVFVLLSLSDTGNGMMSVLFECKSQSFRSDSDLKEFISRKRNEDLAIYNICKYVDLSNLSPHWNINYALVGDTKSIRNKKINSITI